MLTSLYLIRKVLLFKRTRTNVKNHLLFSFQTAINGFASCFIFYDAEQYGITYIIDKDNSPWFKSEEIETILEYRHSLCADHQKQWYEIDGPGNEDPYTLFVNTSGLLQWLSSTIETLVVMEFKRWMTNELLPLIRGPHIVQIYKKIHVMCLFSFKIIKITL
ncbi:hypothetical protein CEXT_377251 [Caerostris extrusa]|uniref:Bro-N domain-containing protein n=1 Tax=Caerostris extrusa TaxID=172846 RepID=A0AAV4VNM0_CAEEX|nr:hypothetical protein CEXT_377251 [Caerostris extrusa]